jgi:hypothetical protein
MTHESVFKYGRTWLHTCGIVGAAWILLGIGTGLVAHYPLARLVFIGTAWLVLEAGWDFLNYHKSTTYTNEEDIFWTKFYFRIVSYSRPLFYIWLGILTQHILWWNSGFIELNDAHKFVFWGQMAVVLLCTTTSFWAFISETRQRRNYLKWFMMMVVFLVPPWHNPWYAQPILVIQVRWMIMVALFVLQSIESSDVASIEKRYLADLYLIRIGWVPVVPPILLLYAIVSFLYYAFVLVRVRIETTIPKYTKRPQETQYNEVDLAQLMRSQEYRQVPVVYTQDSFVTSTNAGWGQFSAFGNY